MKTASGTTYGEEKTFMTDATGIGNMEIDTSVPVVTGYYDLNLTNRKMK
ncbi:MAG: hypothetical protein ACI4TK_09825 [Agathobacter sp.]